MLNTTSGTSELPCLAPLSQFRLLAVGLGVTDTKWSSASETLKMRKHVLFWLYQDHRRNINSSWHRSYEDTDLTVALMLWLFMTISHRLVISSDVEDRAECSEVPLWSSDSSLVHLVSPHRCQSLSTKNNVSSWLAPSSDTDLSVFANDGSGHGWKRTVRIQNAWASSEKPRGLDVIAAVRTSLISHHRLETHLFQKCLTSPRPPESYPLCSTGYNTLLSPT